MAIYEGLIIPRSYNAYINKSSPQDLYNMINNHNMAAGIVSASNKLVTESSTGVAQIEKLIPPQASEENQLADKDFVNSSISTNTANYIYKTNSGGEKVPFDSVSELEAYSGTVTQNDYAFVTGTDESGNTYFDRYKANVNGEVVIWAKEYRQNNSGFTSDQWAAIISGITAEKVAQYDAMASIAEIFNVCHPIGEVYVQFPNEPAPQTVYNRGTWTEITENYAGNFFRAEGGDSAEFGEVQAEGLPNITGKFDANDMTSTSIGTADLTPHYNGQWNDVRVEGACGTITNYEKHNGAGDTGGYGRALVFNASKGETKLDGTFKNDVYGKSDHVTPVNTAIRIWKRTA